MPSYIELQNDSSVIERIARADTAIGIYQRIDYIYGSIETFLNAVYENRFQEKQSLIYMLGNSSQYITFLATLFTHISIGDIFPDSNLSNPGYRTGLNLVPNDLGFYLCMNAESNFSDELEKTRIIENCMLVKTRGERVYGLCYKTVANQQGNLFIKGGFYAPTYKDVQDRLRVRKDSVSFANTEWVFIREPLDSGILMKEVDDYMGVNRKVQYRF